MGRSGSSDLPFCIFRTTRKLQRLARASRYPVAYGTHPLTALVKRESQITEVKLTDVATNETIIIKSGAKVPLDGIVIKGASSINQAPITGESLPVEKKVGDQIFAGTINGEGSLEATVTGKAGETTLY